MAKDGLYCMGCVLFPDSSHRRPKKLISEPFQNWKDALEDLKNHASCKYHCNSMAKLWAFLGTYENYASRIDLAIAETSSRTFQQNREVLRSVLKCLEFCGRQGVALRGRRDDETSTSFNKGNFKALLAVYNYFCKYCKRGLKVSSSSSALILR